MRKGVSEVMASAILILIAVSAGTAIYMFAKSTLDTRVASLREEIDRLRYRSTMVTVIDAFYVESNETVVIYIYIDEEGYSLLYDRAYVDNDPVPDSSLLSGFNVYLKVGEAQRLSFIYSLSPGAHEIQITGPEGIGFEVNINA